jgi:hypothetical protein
MLSKFLLHQLAVEIRRNTVVESASKQELIEVEEVVAVGE